MTGPGKIAVGPTGELGSCTGIDYPRELRALAGRSRRGVEPLPFRMRSLGRRTDLMLARFAGEVLDRGAYVVVRTPSNPTYHWGNYLIFRAPPCAGDYERWMELHEREFPRPAAGPAHRLLAWDAVDGELGHPDEFLAHGMRLDQGVVLTARELVPPPRPNDALEVRRIQEPDEWRAVIEEQVLTRAPEYPEDAYRTFQERHFESYREMSLAGLGDWYGAYLDGQLVGDLGIYHEAGLARFQSVCTRPSHRRRGVCGTLVQQAACLLRERAEIHTFVMEADPEYHAARIYESVGFRRTESNHALYWHSEM